jgi:hypothetical protein
MSGFEPKDNSGAVFMNEKRESDRHPLLKGSAMVDGRFYNLAVWGKVSKSGVKYWSLSFKKKEEDDWRSGLKA